MNQMILCRCWVHNIRILQHNVIILLASIASLLADGALHDLTGLWKSWTAWYWDVWGHLRLCVVTQCSYYIHCMFEKHHVWSVPYSFSSPCARRMYLFRAGHRFVPSQWERALLCNNISHWLGANLESDLLLYTCGELKQNIASTIKLLIIEWTTCSLDNMLAADGMVPFGNPILLGHHSHSLTLVTRFSVWFLYLCGSGNRGAAVLLPGFAINW